jgi:glutaredoxin
MKKSFDDINLNGFTASIAGNTDKEILLLSLSTCMWCIQAKKWLSEQGYAYRNIDMDQIPKEDMARIAFDFEKVFDMDITYPMIVVKKTRYHLGFDQEKWKELIDQS